MKNLSDQEIIDSVIKGNDSDYSIIIDRYKNKAFSMLNRMLKNEFDAEEVLQDCFLKAYHSLNNFKGEAKFSTWFYRIVYNTALTKLSSKKRKIETEMSSIEEHFNLESDYNSIDIEKKDLRYIIKTGALLCKNNTNQIKNVSKIAFVYTKLKNVIKMLVKGRVMTLNTKIIIC